jgi:ketosteroid isomerase-like protein
MPTRDPGQDRTRTPEPQELEDMIRFSASRRIMGWMCATFLAVVLVGAAGTARAADMDPGAKALAKVDDEWSKSAATKDAERVASFYAEDAMVYPPNAAAVTGRAAAKTVWASLFADSTFRLAWTTVHAAVAKGGDMGYTAGTYEDSWTGPDGKLMNEKGKYVCVWKKQKDGLWKAIFDAGSAVPSP